MLNLDSVDWLPPQAIGILSFRQIDENGPAQTSTAVDTSLIQSPRRETGMNNALKATVNVRP